MAHKLTTQDAQQRIDDKFGKDFITILDFEGVDRPCKVLQTLIMEDAAPEKFKEVVEKFLKSPS